MTTLQERATTGSLVEQFELGLDAPIWLTWELTCACNPECAHCLSSSGRRDPRELTTEQCEAATDYFDVQIALDGATAEVNDHVRGPGSSDMALTALQNLQDAGFEDAKTSVVCTRQNIGRLDEFKALADRFGATLRLTRLRPSGRGGCMAGRFFTGLPLDGPDPECVQGYGEHALTELSLSGGRTVPAASQDQSKGNPTRNQPVMLQLLAGPPVKGCSESPLDGFDPTENKNGCCL